MNYGDIVDDSLPPLRTRKRGSEEDLDHVVFFGAVEDNQLVVEVSIEGKPRGAMKLGVRARHARQRRP